MTVAILTGCHKDSYEETDSIISQTQIGTIINHTTELGEVAGLVYTEENVPIANASIIIAGQIVESDSDGLFHFESVDLDPQGTYIKAEKDGFILGSDFIYPGPGLNRSYIQMMALSLDKTFEASAGATIQIERGGTIEFNPNSISTALGEAYTGKVYVTAKRLAADDPNLSDKMPGGLVASDQDNRTVVLGTYGMVAVELRGGNGEELNLSPGNTAKISFPLADKDISAAPESIPLWHFDEERGIWIEEGNATRQGDQYVGEVSHFSFWNCDVPFPLITFCVNIFNDDGTPANDVQVTICAGNLGTGQGYACNGVVSGKIPKNETLTLKISGRTDCGEAANYVTEIGPFSNDVKLDPITLFSIDRKTITGKVLCNGIPLGNSAAVITGDNLLDIVVTDRDGNFEYHTCYTGDVEIFGKNLNTNTGGAIQIVTLDDDNLIASVQLETCSDCEFEAEIIVDQGTVCDSTASISILVDGTGTYAYIWSNGATGNTIPEATTGNYSVTVVENGTDCEQVLSTNVQSEISYLAWTFDITEVDCNSGEGGAITIIASNGQAPYTFTWSDPNGQPINGESTIDGLAPGTYAMTITDANNCQIEGQVTVPEAGLDLPNLSGTYTLSCSQNVVLIGFNETLPNLTYSWNDSNGSSISNQQLLETSTPGIYTLTVASTASGCEQNFEFLVVQDIGAPVFEAEFSCEGLTQYISLSTFPNGNFETEIFGLYNTSLSPDNFGSYTVFDFTEDTYSITMTDLNNGCESTQTYTNEAIDVSSFIVSSSVAPSCDTCLDGQITTDITAQDCLDCTIDIYKKENQEYILVSNENTEGKLGVGSHYVAYKDAEGCVLEFLVVEF